MNAASHRPALVARTDAADHASYLALAEDGATRWVEEPSAATVFGSMREAMGAAARQPAALRAFALPHRPEIGFCAAA